MILHSFSPENASKDDAERMQSRNDYKEPDNSINPRIFVKMICSTFLIFIVGRTLEINVLCPTVPLANIFSSRTVLTDRYCI